MPDRGLLAVIQDAGVNKSAGAQRPGSGCSSVSFRSLSSSRVCALPPRAVTLRLREIRYAHAIQQRSDSTDHIPYDFTCLRCILLMLVRSMVTSVEHFVLWPTRQALELDARISLAASAPSHLQIAEPC